MRGKDQTLEDLIAKSTDQLAAQKLLAETNLAKLIQRVEKEQEPVEKARLQALVELHTKYRASLNQVDPVAEATARWNELQARLI